MKRHPEGARQLKVKKLIEVYFGTSMDSGYVKSILEMNGIKASLKDEAMGVIAPWYVTPGGVGAVKVVVLGSQFEKAIQIMRSYSVWPTVPRSTLSRALRCCLVILLLMILAIPSWPG